MLKRESMKQEGPARYVNIRHVFIESVHEQIWEGLEVKSVGLNSNWLHTLQDRFYHDMTSIVFLEYSLLVLEVFNIHVSS